MLTTWFSSWSQQQLQEPFNDQYEEGDEWVQVLTPSMKQPEPKKLSRQERRAKARLEKKKQQSRA